MKRMLSLILLAISCLFLSPTLFAAGESADDDSGTDTKHQVYHVYENIDLVPTPKIVYEKPRIVAKINYPLLTSELENEHVSQFNALVDELIKSEVASYKKQVQEIQSYQSTLPKDQIKNDLTIDFDASVVNTTEKPIISIRFSIQGYMTGMAHPFHRHRVLNYDLDTGEKLEFSSLFKPNSNYLDVISDYSRQMLLKKFKDTQMVLEGTAPKEENYRNWNLNPSGLLITFDEYQVAPYVYGTQTVQIPYSVLNPLFAKDSPIGECLKHSKRCLRNHVLTGGFIDEAVNTHHRKLNPLLSQR